jgi:hypothetical protein
MMDFKAAGDDSSDSSLDVRYVTTHEVIEASHSKDLYDDNLDTIIHIVLTSKLSTVTTSSQNAYVTSFK